MTNESYEVPDMESPEQMLLEYFNSTAYQIKWKDLKRCLLALERNEMVKHIETKTLITQGMHIFKSILYTK